MLADGQDTQIIYTITLQLNKVVTKNVTEGESKGNLRWLNLIYLDFDSLSS